MRASFGVTAALSFWGTLAPAHAEWVAGGHELAPLDTGSQTVVAVVEDGAGGSIVAWAQAGADSTTLRAQRLDASGAPQWDAAGVQAGWSDFSPYAEAAVADGQGGIFVVWHDGSTLNVQRITSAGEAAWGAPVSLDGSSDFSLANAGAGRLIVAWTTSTGFSGVHDIVAMRVDASGVPGWPLPAVPVCTAISTQEYPQVVSDGVGGAIVVWQDDRSGASRDLYAQRLTVNGIPLWGADGLPLCTAPGIQERVCVLGDGAGGVFAAWLDDRAGGLNPADGNDVYAQHLGAVGAAAWPANGVPVCTEAYVQRPNALVPDGSGGVLVVWEDERIGEDITDLYAQRVDAGGISMWSPGGVPVCAAPYDQGESVAVSDGNGGMVAAWVDRRNGYGYARDFEDVYAQHVGASGLGVWPADGLALCTAPFWQRDVRGATDGTGGMFVAWSDGRDDPDGYSMSESRVYWQRLPQAGPPTDAPAAATGAADAPRLENAPNPFSGLTEIRFVPNRIGPVRVTVLDVTGRVVRDRTLQVTSPGLQRLSFDATSASGTPLAAGVYYLRVAAGSWSRVRKMTLVR